MKVENSIIIVIVFLISALWILGCAFIWTKMRLETVFSATGNKSH
jgi:hypothetical protein